MPRDLITITKTYNHFHFCCGLGGGKKGFNRAKPQVGNMAATLRCIGGIDVDPAAIRDFDRAGPGRPGTVMDLFTRAQYIAFHGKEPPAGWREATAEDIRRAAGNESPNIVFISSPCKGASGLLSETLSKTAKYQALNELTLRCIWLMAEAWADNPVDLIVFENVPRLATRGRHLLDQIIQLLQQFGYAVAESKHDCGVLGGLAQSRKRLLLVARHMQKVPPFLYEPHKKQLRAVGDILGRMPFPGDEAGGPMHRIPRLQWKTWLRLALVEAGSDWRSLNRLQVEDGYLRDYIIVPDMHNDALGVRKWDSHSGTVTGNGRPATGAFSVADPRHFGPAKHSNECRVGEWTEPAKVVSGAHGTGQCVADPRFDSGTYDCGQYGLCGWDQTMGAIINVKSPGQGTFAVQDPRPPSGPLFSKYAVTRWEKNTGTVIGGDDQGAYAVADPRSAINNRTKGDAYLTGGHYGIVPWEGQSGAVSAAAGYDNGRWSVADPRIDAAPLLPAQDEKTIAIIRALDGTWHRPFTTLELAALQSLIDPDEHWSTDPQIQMEINERNRRLGVSLCLDGTSDSAHRERIGNAVPPLAAEAIGEVMGITLLLAAAGETFMLSSVPIWVQPVAMALSVAQGTNGQIALA
ncbi:DNA cytosine methyltransferase [Duganella vulcania]|uniref:DNA cytosine methyltransferase n=1 Tax=Duganella vulcania TaxID=2692166 RepID=A0A845GED9_9BURK|nr:DNA cytosine methyltransferase [Duganella vulcania]MYM92664.1 DNA cytosine methyltransferase [Duganella vulcania]